MAGVNVNAEIVQKQIQEMKRTAVNIQKIQRDMLLKYQVAGSGWRDKKYKELGDIVQESSSALSQILQTLSYAEQKLVLLLRQVQEYEAVNLRGNSQIKWTNGQAIEIGHLVQDSTAENYAAGDYAAQEYVAEDCTAQSYGSEDFVEGNSIYSHQMKPEDVNRIYESGVQSIDTTIENYREALIERGVPDGEWMHTVLSQHRAIMLGNLGYTLDQASGHGDDSTNSHRDYAGPDMNPAFYDELVQQYRSSISGG